VITEFGISYLFGRSIRERTVALIEVAHPAHRAALFAKARELGYIGAEHTLKNLRAYHVEEEQQLALKGGRSVLVRPAGSSDSDGIRDLFHRLSERDRYTRLLRKVKGMSHRDVQRPCNLNFENEVAFVPTLGPRENRQVVAHACYFTDPSTNPAETAFMVHPDWQGCGLGSTLQAQLARHARGRGVRGFVAEIMAGNDHTVRLARAAAGNVSVKSSGSTVRATLVSAQLTVSGY
jgi:L-amino acid N-acyltransferase YncA